MLIYWIRDGLKVFRNRRFTCRSFSTTYETMYEKFEIVNEENLTLKCIQVIFRHGARTPLKYLPGIEEVEFDQKWLEPIDTMNFPSQTVAMDGSPVTSFEIEETFKGIYFKGGALAGQLTKIGRTQCHKLGLRLGEKYRKLFSVSYDPSRVWILSSPLNRCVDSLKCVMAGIYSESLRSLDNIPIQADTVQTKMYPTLITCPTYKDALKRMHKQIMEDKDQIKLAKELEEHFGDIFATPTTDLALIYDHIVSRKAHDLPVPKPLEDRLELLEKFAIKYIYMNSGGKYNQVKNGLTMSMGRLADTLANNFEEVAKGETPDKPKSPAVFMFSGHDSTLVPILEMFGFPINKFPNYASDIVLELYEDFNQKLFVQVLYCDKPIILRTCCKAIVTLEAFLDQLKPFRIDFSQFMNLCKGPNDKK